MASFLDYYREELGKRAASSKGAASSGFTTPDNLKGLNAMSPGKSSPDSQGLGGWVLDILDRPRNAVANVAKNAIDQGVDAGEAFSQGDVLGGIGGTLNAIFGSIPAAVQGFVSTNPDDKHSTSKLIEYGTDRIGKSSDKNYVDVEDNVDPVAKGVLGFIGDVASDPINYIPGAILMKGAKAGVGAVDGVIQKGSDALAGVSKEERARIKAQQAGKVTEEASVKVKKGKSEEAPLKDEDFSSFDATDFVNPGKAPTPASSAADLADDIPGNARFTTGMDGVVDDLIPTAPKSPSAMKQDAIGHIQKMLGMVPPSVADDVIPPVNATGVLDNLPVKAPDAPPATGVPASHPDLPAGVAGSDGAIPQPGQSFNDLVMESASRQPILDHIAKIREVQNGEKIETLGGYVKGLIQAGDRPIFLGSERYIKPSEVYAAAASPEVRNNLTKVKRENFELAYDRLKKQLVHKTPAVTGEAKSAFDNLVQRDYAGVENALGSELFDLLTKQSSPKKFEKMVKALEDSLAPGADVAEVLRRTDRRLENTLLNTLGVPRLRRPNTPEEAAEWARRVTTGDDGWNGAVAKAVKSVLSKLESTGEYPYRVTKDGMVVARTSLSRGDGVGKYLGQVNSFGQRTFVKEGNDVIRETSERAAKARRDKTGSYEGKFSKARTVDYRDAKMKYLEAVAETTSRMGIPLASGVGAKTSMLSHHEVLSTLLHTAESAGRVDVANLSLFNYGTSAADTVLLNTVNDALYGATREEIVAGLTQTMKYGAKGDKGEPLANNLASGKLGQTWHFANRQAAVDAAADMFPHLSRTQAGRLVNTKRVTEKRSAQVYYINHTPKGGPNLLVEGLADLIMDSTALLKARAAQNEAAFTARLAEETYDLATSAVKRADDVLKADTGMVAKTAQLSQNARQIVEDGSKVLATGDAVNNAKKLTEASLGPVADMVVPMQRAITASSGASGDLVKAVDDFGDDVWEIVEDSVTAPRAANASDDIIDADIVDDMPSIHDPLRENPNPSPIHNTSDDAFEEAVEAKAKAKKEKQAKGEKEAKKVDLSKDADRMVDEFGNHIRDPYGILKHKVKNWFDQTHLMKNTHPVFHKWQNTMAMRASYMNNQLNALNRMAVKAGDVDRKMMASAFSNIQRGIAPSNKAEAELQEMMTDMVRDFFDLDAAGSMGNVFLRTTSKPDLITETMKAKGIDTEKIFFISKTADGKKISADDVAQQWRDWEIKDPLDLMHRMNLVREELSINAGTARSFIQLAKDSGAYSKVPKAGHVKLMATGNSRFIAHMPNNTYVKKELADEMQRLETVLRTSREFDGALGNFVRNYYGPALNAWKRTITIMRPGHHVRNYIGSTSATYIRRGNKEFKRSHDDAFKILSTRNNYEGVDMLGAAAKTGNEAIPQNGDVLFTLSGDRGKLTNDEVYSYMAENGALPTFRASEDFVDTGNGGFARMAKMASLENTRVGKFAGGVSEYTDHFTRTQHFMQAMRQDAAKFPNMSKKELMDQALKETNKYHPDASLLTPTEAKIRLAIPFYTWMAKMMPALVESAVMHPGRLTMFNKASYNVAVAAGIDPESLTDPFPDDQMFPSFLKEGALGPQLSIGGNYYRVNPGVAHLDVMSTFGNDPFRGLLGMTSPLLRVPAEIASGGSWGTGGQIKDTSDYLDQSLPFVNYFANITGISPTGSIGSLASGNGLDMQAGFQEKADGSTNKGDNDRLLSALNWVSGLGIQNLSRPNYQNYAEIELRNEAREQSGK